MPLFSLRNSGKNLNEEYHDTRHRARTTTVKIEEWSDIEQTLFDLDTVDFDTKQVDRFYLTRADVEAEGASQPGFDIREIDTVRD